MGKIKFVAGRINFWAFEAREKWAFLCSWPPQPDPEFSKIPRMASPVMGVVIPQSTVAPSLCSRSSPLNAPPLRGRKEVRRCQQRRWCVGIRAEAMATEKLGVKVLKNPQEEKLAELGVRSWPKWGCPPSKFPWEYTAKETCYLLQGKVKVFPEGHGEGYVEIEAGDLVEFPKGMKCTWDVSVAVDKHYNFE